MEYVKVGLELGPAGPAPREVNRRSRQACEGAEDAESCGF
jgi:hypothetical protein